MKKRRMVTRTKKRGKPATVSIEVFTLDAPNAHSLKLLLLPTERTHVGFLPLCCPTGFLPALLRAQKDESKPAYLNGHWKGMVHHFQGKTVVRKQITHFRQYSLAFAKKRKLRSVRLKLLDPILAVFHIHDSLHQLGTFNRLCFHPDVASFLLFRRILNPSIRGTFSKRASTSLTIL